MCFHPRPFRLVASDFRTAETAARAGLQSAAAGAASADEADAVFDSIHRWSPYNVAENAACSVD